MENLGSINDDFENDSQTMKEKRGTFLLVLCILSWITSGFGLLGTLATFFGGESGLEEQISTIENSPSLGFAILDNAIEMSIQTLELTLENFQLYHIGNALIFLTGIFAVYLMFNLKKTGFYLYITYLISNIVLYGYVLGELPTSTASMAMTGVMSLVFIILYAVNLKRMTE